MQVTALFGSETAFFVRCCIEPMVGRINQLGSSQVSQLSRKGKRREQHNMLIVNEIGAKPANLGFWSNRFEWLRPRIAGF